MLKYLCIDVEKLSARVVTTDTVEELLAVEDAIWLVFEIETDSSVRTLIDKNTWCEVPE